MSSTQRPRRSTTPFAVSGVVPPASSFLLALFGNTEGPRGIDEVENTTFIQQSLREVVGKIETLARAPVAESESEFQLGTDQDKRCISECRSCPVKSCAAARA